MSSASLWSRLVRSIAGTKTTQKSIKRPLRAFPSLESLEGRTVPATAILNPTGGLTSTDGIRTEFADGQFMVYKNNVKQLYNGITVPNSNNFNSIYLSVGNDTVGGTFVGYLAPGTWSKAGSNMTRSNWTNVNTSTVLASGANSFFTSSMSYTNATGTYVVDLRVDYTAPDVFHKQTYTVTIPSGNTKDVRLYMAYDTYLGGSDAGPGYVDSTGDPTVNNGVVEVGVYGSTVTESIQYVSGIAWESYASMGYPSIVRSFSGYGPGFGTPFTNGIDSRSDTDNGIGINWNFGSTPGVQAPVAYNFAFNTPAPPDTTPPATPVITSVTVDTGSSTTDQITNDNTLTFTGTAEANSAVKVFNGSTLLGTAKASGTGAYAVTASVLPDGTYPNFRVTATDAAGNQSGAATVTPWTIDTVSLITVTGVASDTGISPTDKITNDNTLTITGMAEPNSLVAVFDNGVQVGTATASGTGAYSVTTSALSDASHVLTITAADIAGNVSSSTPLGTWIVDTIAPSSTPVVVSVTVDTGSSTTDQITSDSTLTFTGTAEANSVVQVFDGTTLIGTTTASGTGAYAVTASLLPDGTYPNLKVTASDVAGNQSGAATVTLWTIDTVSNITVTGVTSDTGSSSTDKITNDNTLTITGMAEPNSLVAVFDNGVQVGTATASGTGAYSVTTSALSNASHVLTITATDIAGNVSPATPLGTWIVDTIAPATPVVVSVTVDTGSSTTDQITSDNTLTFTGTAEANSVVQVFNGTTLIGTTTASATGAYAVTASVLPDGTYPNFRVTASDAAGNQSGAATVTPWTIDTTAPATPLVASVTVDTGISTTDQITNNNTLTVTGTAAANSIVNVFDGGVLVGTTTASGTGAYSVTTSVLADGVHSALTVTATDLAGNASGAATITPWTIDTVAPVVDMVADSTDSDGTYKKNQTLTIELTLDEVVYVNGIPCLDLNSGGLAEYVSGSGTNTLVFTYTIQRGESTPVGSFLSVLGFDLTNGSITDAAGNIPALLLNTVTNGNLDANNQLVVDSSVGVTLVPYAGSFIDDTVTPGSGKTNLASLSYLATFDEVVDNFPRQAFQTSGLLLTSVHRIADKTGLHWKIDAKPTNALGTLGSTSIQVVASTFTDVFMNSNLASNVVTVDVLRDMKMTSTLSAGANSAKVIGRVTTLSGLSVVFSGPVDPATVVASAFNTFATGAISNIVVAADNLSATFDLNINNGGTAFNGSVRFSVIDKAIQDEYGNKVKGGTPLQWTYDGQGATAVFGSSAAARVRAGQQIEWTVKFSEAVAFSKGNLTVTIGGVTVNSSQISVRGSGSSYTVTLKTTTALKGALVVAMKSGSASPLDLRGNQMAVIPSNLAKTTII